MPYIATLIIAAVLGYTVTNDERVKTQYDQLKDIPTSELQNQVIANW